MTEHTHCWLANMGETGVPIVVSITETPYVLPHREVVGKA
jgi:hypothetical protein